MFNFRNVLIPGFPIHLCGVWEANLAIMNTTMGQELNASLLFLQTTEQQA